jgi:hypothetical protein
MALLYLQGAGHFVTTWFSCENDLRELFEQIVNSSKFARR